MKTFLHYAWLAWLALLTSSNAYFAIDGARRSEWVPAAFNAVGAVLCWWCAMHSIDAWARRQEAAE